VIHPLAPPLVLASGSATRRILLHQAGLVFTVRASAVDEDDAKRRIVLRGGSAADAALVLASAKAEASAKAGVLGRDEIVVAADQILVCDGIWFNKPRTLDEAASHLRALRGRAHHLITAATCWRDGQSAWSIVDRAALIVRPLSDAFIDSYVVAEGDALLSTVGAYRIEGRGIHLFEAIEGESTAIQGLPMLPLCAYLRTAGVLLA